MKKTLLTIGGTVLVIFILIMAIPSEKTESQDFINDVAKEVKQKDLTTESNTIYGSYMEGCLAESTSREYCDCTYDYLVDRKGEEYIVKMGFEVLDEDVSADVADLMMDAIYSCVDLL